MGFAVQKIFCDSYAGRELAQIIHVFYFGTHWRSHLKLVPSYSSLHESIIFWEITAIVDGY